MKVFKGELKNIDKNIIAEVTYNKTVFNRSGKAFVGSGISSCPFGYSVLITDNKHVSDKAKSVFLLENKDLSDLNEGDIIHIGNNGVITTVWDTKSDSNTIFPTASCDCRCLMCPQPPQKHDDELYYIAMEILNRLEPSKISKICISGGEPTSLGDKFLNILNKIKERFDHALVMLLTNGRSFSDFNFAKEFSSVNLSNCLICISLHSDVEELNDEISGSKSSFQKTIQGLYNLAKFRQKVEIRHVINKLNYERLEEFAYFLYRNFPFVYHVAFMGMEITGYARSNYDKVWIDPAEYKKQLENASKILHRAFLNTSIYNIPYCLLTPVSWSFARQSISDWKNHYLPVCDGCLRISECCGFFSTSGDFVSPSVSKII